MRLEINSEAENQQLFAHLSCTQLNVVYRISKINQWMAEQCSKKQPKFWHHHTSMNQDAYSFLYLLFISVAILLKQDRYKTNFLIAVRRLGIDKNISNVKKR